MELSWSMLWLPRTAGRLRTTWAWERASHHSIGGKLRLVRGLVK